MGCVPILRDVPSPERQSVSAQVSVPETAEADELRSALDEIESLRQRVDDLEGTVAAYRGQMNEVLRSASWRSTRPFRGIASRLRSGRVRTRRMIRRGFRRRDSPKSTRYVGLVMPNTCELPELSPLREPQALVALQRPAAADGDSTLRTAAILVVAHVHYPELWQEISDRLVRIPEAFDLLVTVTQGSAESAIPGIVAAHPNAVSDIVPNRGRDWAPMVSLVNRGMLRGYDVVAKVHTKKSVHRVDGERWRTALLDGVLESPTQIRRTVALLREDRSVGLVVPTGQVQGAESWGSDQSIVETLAARLPMAFEPDRLRFPAGSMFWCRPWLLERLADLDIDISHFEPEGGQYDGTTAHALERMVGIMADVAGMQIVESSDVASILRAHRRAQLVRPSVYAFYLPQYHRTPDNDEFWGEGFTDWVNVRRSRPLFPSHRQPNLPSAQIGEYDLSDPEVLRSQGRAAQAHGVDGFLFHYYWFDGRHVLDTPLRIWRADPSIDVPLALCWANEPWTRRWDGLEQDVLIQQAYSDGWVDRFWDDIAPVVQDPRYITIDGCPLLILYRLDLIPDLAQTVAAWRKRARKQGFPDLHVLGVRPSRDFGALPASARGCLDGLIAFAPGSGLALSPVPSDTLQVRPGAVQQVYSLHDAFAHATSDGDITTVIPGWDNSPRRGASSYVFVGSNPVTWARTLRQATAGSTSAQRPLLINAWNEWAEGAAIEPSARFRDGFLTTIEDVFPRHGARSGRGDEQQH